MALPLAIIMGWRVRSWALVCVSNSPKKKSLGYFRFMDLSKEDKSCNC